MGIMVKHQLLLLLLRIIILMDSLQMGEYVSTQTLVTDHGINLHS